MDQNVADKRLYALSPVVSITRCEV